MLQAVARRSGLDLKNQANIVYGAPPLLSQKALQGELDATLTFWNFCAELEGKGFKRAIDMEEIEKRLGATGPVAMIGYAFDGDWAAKNKSAVDRFLETAAKAKDILATSEAEWQRLAPRIGVSDKAGARDLSQALQRGHSAPSGRGRGTRRPRALPGARRDRWHQARRPARGDGQGHVLRSGKDRLNLVPRLASLGLLLRRLVCRARRSPGRGCCRARRPWRSPCGPRRSRATSPFSSASRWRASRFPSPSPWRSAPCSAW